jgi:hypothetical protein
MTAPGLVITDASGDTLHAFPTPAGSFTITAVEAGEPATVILDRPQVRELFRWLAAWLGESQLGYARCSGCNLLFDPVTGHHCSPTHDGLYDDEQVRSWLAAAPPELPPAVSKTAVTGDATVTHVEGQPQ